MLCFLKRHLNLSISTVSLYHCKIYLYLSTFAASFNICATNPTNDLWLVRGQIYLADLADKLTNDQSSSIARLIWNNQPSIEPFSTPINRASIKDVIAVKKGVCANFSLMGRESREQVALFGQLVKATKKNPQKLGSSGPNT